MPLHTPLEKNQLFSSCAAAVREIAMRPHVSAEAFHNQLMLRGLVEVPVLVWPHRAAPSPLLPTPGEARTPPRRALALSSTEKGFVSGSQRKSCLFLSCFPAEQEPLTLQSPSGRGNIKHIQSVVVWEEKLCPSGNHPRWCFSSF